MIKVLLNNEADIEAREESGHTALHNAVLEGNVNTVQLLLEKGADATSRVISRYASEPHCVCRE